MSQIDVSLTTTSQTIDVTIEKGGSGRLEHVKFTENGIYTPSGDINGYDQVEVDVNPLLQSINVSENGIYTPEEGFYGLSSVTVETPVIRNQDKKITQNGVYTADSGYSGLGTVEVEVEDIPAVIEPLTINPSTSEQVITASGIDGYNPITAKAVTSSIDSNITSGNIKSGITILGVNGSVIELDGETTTVTPTTSQQTIIPTSPHNGLTEVTVNAVDSNIDPNILSNNIIQGVSILGVSGSAVELKGDILAANPTTSLQTFTPTGGHNGYTEVTITGVDSTIDSNITAGNIKNGVTILGVQGTYEGIQPSGTIAINTNGTHNVSSYEYANVSVPLPQRYMEWTVNQSGVLNFTSSKINLAGVTDIADAVLSSKYQSNPLITGTIDMSSLTSLSGTNACDSMCFNCIGITGLDMSSLVTISGSYCCESMCSRCTGLLTIDLGSLTTISGGYSMYNAFNGCSSLTSINLSSLVRITAGSACQYMLRDSGLTSINLGSLQEISGNSACYYMLDNSTNLSSVDLSSLSVITGSGCMSYMFYRCSSLTSLSFPAITTTSFGSYVNQFNNMCAGIPNIALHFPSNVQSVIEGLTGYSTSAPFGAASGTVSFDLPATE